MKKPTSSFPSHDIFKKCQYNDGSEKQSVGSPYTMRSQPSETDPKEVYLVLHCQLFNITEKIAYTPIALAPRMSRP
jgi:hypothetical protein